MKKHKILSVMALTAATILSAGCAEDFLSTSPLTQKTDVSYYTTPSEALEALTGCYDGLQLMSANCMGLYLAPEMTSDECLGGSGTNDGSGYPDLNTFTDNWSYNQNLFESDWKNTYKTLNRINTLISKIDQITGWKSDAEKNEVLAEAKFLRSFCYFYLVRIFGTCPLLDKPTSETVPNASYTEIYSLIFEDLKYASENGSEDASAAKFGHANKWAAKALLGRAYLYFSGYYGEEPAGCSKAEATAAIDDVVKSGKFALQNPYTLWPGASQYKNSQENSNWVMAYDAASNYAYAGEANPDFIFSIRHTYLGNYNGNTESCNWIDDISIRNLDKASKANKTYGYQKGWGICTVSKHFYDSFESGDLRREASILDCKAELGDDVTNSVVGSDVQEYTGYHIKKYLVLADKTDPTAYAVVTANPDCDFQIGNSQDYVQIRYADVLLMQSELHENTDGWNEVRKNAGLSEVSAFDKEKLFLERAHELCFEGIRYWDMLRFDGIKGNFAYAVNCFKSEDVYNGAAKKATVNYNTANLVKHKGLFPIPTNQIALSNGAVSQNDGWKDL